jgi:uncharacterized protein (DUF1015 family)
LGKRVGEITELEEPELADLCPFKGVRYNASVVKDLGKTICPPYDVITPEQQRAYYEKDVHNVIRLEYPAEQPGDDAESNRYARAAACFHKWLDDKVLEVEQASAFYLHDHYFTHTGEERRRRGLIARVRLQPWYQGIYPHEETYSKAKSDRLQLMRACRASFSSILALYHDWTQGVAEVLSKAERKKPIIECSCERCEGFSPNESHLVRRIDEPTLISQIIKLLADLPLYVADGHHRYETALAYQQERAQAIGSPGTESGETAAGSCIAGNEAFNYVMVELVAFSDPGITVLPIHRLLRGVSASALAELRKKLEHVFSVESVSVTKALISDLKGRMPDGALLGILGLDLGCLLLLRQRQDMPIEAMMPKGRSQAYKNFDVSILSDLILDGMLGFAGSHEHIAYSVDMDEVWQAINKGDYQLAFLVNEPEAGVIKAIADAKDRMPRKSTYFYPKLPAGLVINSLD